MSLRTIPKEVADRRYRLLPSVLEHVAAVTPERVYAAVPKAPGLEGGLHEVTFSQILKAIDGFAYYLQNSIGISTSFEALEYVGVDDLRYVVFFFACIKLGYKALFVSPRITAEQNARLLDLAQCRHLFYAEEVAVVAGRFAAAAKSIEIHELKSFEHWLAVDSKPMPFLKTFEEARYDPVLVLHSSGSTGPPKIVTQTHQWIINNQKQYEGRPVVGMTPYDFRDGGFYLGVFPFFHLAGFFLACVYPIYSHSAAILIRPTSRPPTPELLFNLMGMCRVRTLAAPPSIIEGLARLPHGTEQLANLDYLHYAGGPLEKSCGDILSQTVKVCSSFGTTETGHILSYMPTSSEWQFFEFHPAHNVVLEEEGDGTYELVLYQDRSGACNRPIDGTILRNEPVWRSKDLFINDPRKTHLWRYCGRKDDIIVFSTGQKWNPVPSEALIQGGSRVEGVLIAGEGHAEPALLIETPDHERNTTSLLNRVWPAVEDANSKTQRYGRISRSRIAFVKPGTFVRTGKATIVRKASLALLESTLDLLYNDDTHDINGGHEAYGDDAEPKEQLPTSIIDIVRRCVQQIQTVNKADDEEDLFVCGLDSLEAAELARNLKTALRPFTTVSGLKFLDSGFVFQNPTISWLSAATRANMTGNSSKISRQPVSFTSLLTKYCESLDAIASKARLCAEGFTKVGITGSTGSLGSHILALLLQDSRITQVVCLNRNANISAPSGDSHSHVQASKASFMAVDFTKPYLGLSSEDTQVIADLDVIIHCAWEVNFNRNLNSFEPQIRALVDLTKISLSGKRSPRLVFISSLSAVDEECPEVLSQGCVPEALVTETDNAGRMGYAMSKNLGEHLLALSAKKHCLPATVVRVGQIAGSTKSADPAWNRKEWLPSLIDTSASMRCLPKDQPAVDWIPVNICAQAIVDLTAHDMKFSDFKVYNLVNPNPSPWSPLASTIQNYIPEPCELVSLTQWTNRLKQCDDGQAESLQTYPSLKLLSFFEKSMMKAEGGRKVSTTAACAASGTLANLDPIGEAQMSVWMEQWGY